MRRTYSQLPPIIDPGYLERYLETLGLIVPLARTNLITNSSLETGTTNYTASGASIARSTAEQYHGSYSLAITPTAAVNDGAYYTLASVMTATVTYAVSCKVKGRAGVPYKFSMATSAGVDLTTYRFRATGRWQWIRFLYTETSTTTRRIYLTKDNSNMTGVFYWDGLQLESVADGYNVATTYIDGDQRGLIANQYPPAYGWTGTPHASTSYRSGQTRAGGRIVLLKHLGFYLTAIIGLGLAPPDHQILTFAQLDGGQYQNTIKPPRQFSLAGRIVADTPNGASAQLSRLSRALDRDVVALRQPLVLTTHAQECNEQCGEDVRIEAIYRGGLEGNVLELPSQQVPITFTQHLPLIQGRDQGSALNVQTSIASPGGILARSPTGTWSALGTGVAGGDVRAIVVAPNGLIYVGGTFTSAGSTSADFIASYNPATGTWAVLGSATALNAEVNALAVGPDGRIYVGGSFTNASGIANADNIAVWDPVGASWAALSTGMNLSVTALAWVGNTLYAGGNFTTAGGVAAARVAAWNGSAWSALGTGANDTVWALAAGPGGILYIGGEFTNGGGVAAADSIGYWDGSGWGALSTGMDLTVNKLVVGPDGTLYAGGIFTTAGGITAGGIASWNGVQWSRVGSGFSSPGTSTPTGFAIQPNGELLIAANDAVVDAGTPGYILKWNGSAYVSLGLLTTAGEGTAIALAPDGTIYAGVSGTIVVAATTTITNSGTVGAYPTLTVRGPSSGTSRIYELINRTTNVAVYLNLTVSAGETVVLTLDPTNITCVSSFQGNVLNTVLPGSNLADFVVQPDSNVMTFLAASSTVTATLEWQIGYGSLNDTLYQAVAA